MWVITAKMTKDHCGFRNTGLENSDKLGAVTNYANRRKLNHRSSYTSSLGQVFVAVKSEKVAFIFDDSCIYAQEIAYMRTFDCERLDTTYFRLCSLGQRPRFSTLPPPIDFGHCGTWLQSRNQLGTTGGAQIFWTTGMSNNFKIYPIFQRGATFSKGGILPLRPLVTGLLGWGCKTSSLQTNCFVTDNTETQLLRHIPLVHAIKENRTKLK